MSWLGDVSKILLKQLTKSSPLCILLGVGGICGNPFVFQVVLVLEVVALK